MGAMNDKNQKLKEIAVFFDVLSDPLRLRILELLPKAESESMISVCQLAKILQMSQPTISHHLKLLKSVGLIRCHKLHGCSYYLVDSKCYKTFLQKTKVLFDRKKELSELS